MGQLVAASKSRGDAAGTGVRIGGAAAIATSATSRRTQAVRLPPPFNSPGFDFTPSFSADGRALIFASDRAPKAMTLSGAGAGGLSDLHAAPTALLPPEPGADAR